MTETTTESATDLRRRECVDVLPLRGGHRLALRWIPRTGDFTPQAGFMVLEDAKTSTAYSVTECPTHYGRSFFVAKVGGRGAGTDKGRESYSVECGPTEATDRCDCRGFMHGHCRHADGLRTLLLNAWI